MGALCIDRWVETDTTKALGKKYGGNWEHMAAVDVTAILAALAIAAHELAVNDGECANLCDIADSHDLQVSDPISSALYSLDGEMDAEDLLSLIQGIVQNLEAQALGEEG